jgi:hypothetical protein
MSDEQVLDSLSAILAATNLGAYAAAPIVGVAGATLRHALVARRLPKGAPGIRIARFVEVNRAARTRDQIKLVA